MSGRPGARAVGAVLALLTVLAGLPLVTAGPAAAAGPAADVQLTRLDPTAAGPTTPLRVIGTVRNSGDERLFDVQIRLRLSRSRVNSRAELSRVADGETESKDGDVLISRRLPDDLRRGQVARYNFSYDLRNATNLNEFGVYVLGVEVVAGHRDGYGRVGILRTFLPFVPKQADFRPTGFAWLWPLVAAPRQLADGTFAREDLRREVHPGGRLDRLLHAGIELGGAQRLTWVVDPELLEAVSRLASGDYFVRGPDGRRLDGPADASAAQWLDTLRAATGGQDVLALPYGDPDLVALHRGDLSNSITAARTTGSDVTDRILGREVVDDVVWPIDGYTDKATLTWLRDTGTRAVILDGRALPAEFSLNYTPSGRASVRTSAGDVVGLVHDPVLRDQLRDPGESSLLGAQRFLAETAMITAELPSTGTERVIMVAPPRRWSPDATFLGRLVAGASAAPWLGPVSLDEMLDRRPAEVDRGKLVYPRAQRAGELSATYLAALQDMSTDVTTFAAVLTDPEREREKYEAALLRLDSSWWRRRPSRVAQLTRERDLLARQRNMVRVLPGNYTFGSQSDSKIPLTIINELGQSVVLDVALRPQTRRLVIGDSEPKLIGAHRKVQLEVDARAVANGQVQVDVTLLTPDGTPYSAPVPLQVRITQYGTVALFITIGAAGVLFLAAGVRVTRRIRRAKRAAHAAGPGDDDWDGAQRGDPGDDDADGASAGGPPQPEPVRAGGDDP